MSRFIYLLFVLVFIWSCQKNPSEATTSDNDVVLNEKVTILKESENNSIQYVSTGRDTVKFIYSVPLLHRLYKEQILVSKWQNGFVVKVLDIKIENNQIVLITRPASLTEIFEKCKLDTIIRINPQQVQKIETLRKGLKVEHPYDDLFKVDIEDVILFDSDGNEYTIYDQLKADGHYSFGIDLDFKFAIDNFQLTYLLFKSTITQTGQLDLYQNVSLLDYENKVDLVKYFLSPITVMVGPVPVVIQPVVRFVVGAEAKFDVQVTSTLIRQESFTSGLELKNGSWQQISESENNFNYKPPSLSAGGLLKGYAGPQVDLMIYGLIGPYMLVDPYLELDADIQKTPWWTLYGGLEVGVGVHLEIFDQTLADAFYPKVIDLKNTVAFATEEPPEDNNQPQLIAYYPFNGNANDESGNGHNGQIYGANLTEDRFGNANSAYQFDGVNDYIMIPTSDQFKFEKFSISVWFYLDKNLGYTQARVINRQGTAHGSESWGLEVKGRYYGDTGPGNNLDFHTGNCDYYGIAHLNSSTDLSDREWYHVVAVHTGDSTYIYINNKLDGKRKTYGPPCMQNNEPIVIGYSRATSEFYFPGRIDDIRIYNYPLSKDEISVLYHENGWTGDNGQHSNFPSNSLIAYYPFNGNANDKSGFGNNGTVHGASLTSDRFGNANSAYHFDGYNDYLEIPDFVMNNLPKGSFSAWIKLDELNRQHGIIDETKTYVANYFQVIIDYNNMLRVNIDVHYGEILRLYSNTIFDKDTWYHVVVTWDGNYWKIYLNGQLDAQATRDRTVPNASRPLLIGKVDGNTSFMKGTIDDIRIYNYVLSDSEIYSLYHENGW